MLRLPQEVLAASQGRGGHQRQRETQHLRALRHRCQNGGNRGVSMGKGVSYRDLIVILPSMVILGDLIVILYSYSLHIGI